MSFKVGVEMEAYAQDENAAPSILSCMGSCTYISIKFLSQSRLLMLAFPNHYCCL